MNHFEKEENISLFYHVDDETELKLLNHLFGDFVSVVDKLVASFDQDILKKMIRKVLNFMNIPFLLNNLNFLDFASYLTIHNLPSRRSIG